MKGNKDCKWCGGKGYWMNCLDGEVPCTLGVLHTPDDTSNREYHKEEFVPTFNSIAVDDPKLTTNPDIFVGKSECNSVIVQIHDQNTRDYTLIEVHPSGDITYSKRFGNGSGEYGNYRKEVSNRFGPLK